jgi:hypothetical protein
MTKPPPSHMGQGCCVLQPQSTPTLKSKATRPRYCLPMQWQYQLIVLPHIRLVAELPAEQAAQCPDIAAVVRRYAAEGWVLDGAYPAHIGAQLYFRRPRPSARGTP